MVGAVIYRGFSSYIEGDGFARHGLDGGPVLTPLKYIAAVTLVLYHITVLCISFTQVVLSTTLLALLRTTGIVIFAFSNQAQVCDICEALSLYKSSGSWVWC